LDMGHTLKGGIEKGKGGKKWLWIKATQKYKLEEASSPPPPPHTKHPYNYAKWLINN
jgi:hypothetical protein